MARNYFKKSHYVADSVSNPVTIDGVVGLGETSKFNGGSPHIQQPAAANLYRKSYTNLLNAAAFWLQLAVTDFDDFPYIVLAKYFSIARNRFVAIKSVAYPYIHHITYIWQWGWLTWCAFSYFLKKSIYSRTLIS